MKRFISTVLAGCLILAVTACNNQHDDRIDPTTRTTESKDNRGYSEPTQSIAESVVTTETVPERMITFETIYVNGELQRANQYNDEGEVVYSYRLSGDYGRMTIFERKDNETTVYFVPCERLMSKDLRYRDMKPFADDATAENEPLIESKYVYDGSDRLIYEEQYRYKNPISRRELDALYKTDYTYAEDGSVTETTYVETYATGSGEVVSSITYTNAYDAYGNQTHEEFLASTLTELYVETRELENKYDAKGNLISVDTYKLNSDGSRDEKVGTDVLEYDESGNLVHEVITGLSEGEVGLIQDIVFEYDSNGFLTHKHFDEQLPNYESYASSEDYVYEYDEEGNVIKEEFIKEDPWAGTTSTTTEYIYDYNINIETTVGTTTETAELSAANDITDVEGEYEYTLYAGTTYETTLKMGASFDFFLRDPDGYCGGSTYWRIQEFADYHDWLEDGKYTLQDIEDDSLEDTGTHTIGFSNIYMIPCGDYRCYLEIGYNDKKRTTKAIRLEL